MEYGESLIESITLNKKGWEIATTQLPKPLYMQDKTKQARAYALCEPITFHFQCGAVQFKPSDEAKFEIWQQRWDLLDSLESDK